MIQAGIKANTMSIEIQEPEVRFPEGFDDRWEYEMPLKGYLNEVTVRIDSGPLYLVNFIDPIRLSQDLEAEVKSGRPYFTEPGLIVLPEVTRKAIFSAIKALWNEGFFESLLPCPEHRNGRG
jgi:hypothetical protein